MKRYSLFFIVLCFILFFSVHVAKANEEEQGLVVVPDPELLIPEGFDPYKVLNVEHSASRSEIKRAYKKLLTVIENTPSFQFTVNDVELAYKILGTATNRKNYDNKHGISGGAIEEL